MRHIKFRFWNPFNRVMQYSGDSTADFFRDYEEAVKGENNPKLMQFTGLYDKNYREIYEGDILEFTVFDHNGRDTIYQGVVLYGGSRFMLWNSLENEMYGSDGGFDLDWILSQDDEAEIIGNIHDNPELMEE